MNDPNRKLARLLAAEAISQGKPLEWFETLYRQAEEDKSIIPWVDMRVNPNVATWLERAAFPHPGGSALVIGCGLGDDAQALQAAGLHVTAFDISKTCIAWCRRRFPESVVGYVVADLFAPPARWHQAFDLVIEAYTLQVLPRELRAVAMQQVGCFVAADGRLVVITRGRDPNDDPGQMPWPLVREELAEFDNAGLKVVNLEDYVESWLTGVGAAALSTCSCTTSSLGCWAFHDRRQITIGFLERKRLPRRRLSLGTHALMRREKSTPGCRFH